MAPPRPDPKAKRAADPDMLEADVLAEEVEALELALQALRTHYEQYFLGMEKRAPAQQHSQLRARLEPLRTPLVKNAVLGFRIRALQQRVATYERLWSRTLQEMENGTYRRDLFKARMRRRNSSPETAASSTPVPMPSPARPQPAPSEPVLHIAGTPSKAHPDPLSEPRLRTVYQAYVEAKKRCNEDTTRLSFNSVAESLRKQVPGLLQKHGARDVEYRVFVKDGRAVLRAVPKTPGP
jgi:hypothetical protein